MLFKKKKENFVCPADGVVIDISEVSDPVFSQKMMGDGFAVKPTIGEVYAPFESKVTSIFPTKHAIGLLSKNGVECLVHIGIDTVELNGEPFEILVNEGDTVSPTTLLAKIDLDKLEQANKEKDVMVVFTNLDVLKMGFSLTSSGIVTKHSSVGTLN